MLHTQSHDDDTVEPMFGWREMREPIPRWTIPDGELPAAAAAQLIRDELSLDGTPLLNLASFVTTWMEPEADALLAEARNKNFVDQEEYPRTAELERRCVSMIADLFGASNAGTAAVGTSTVGSSEAILLCGLALDRLWRAKRKEDGKSTDHPNIVLGTHVHVCWEKFCRYFGLEPRWIPVSAGAVHLDVEAAAAAVDENTIGAVAVLGNTYTGAFDDVAALAAALDARAAAGGPDVPIHVDAASGGFVAPFAYPDLAWDFRLPRVASINTSGHKYGLVYPGVGWAVWRDAAHLPDELVFHDNYLGNDQITFSLNFSKGAAQVIGQYYNLVRLGRAGYQSIVRNLLDIAGDLEQACEDAGFSVVSEGDALPLVTVGLRQDAPFTAYDVANHLRRRGWIVPAYTLPKSADDVHVLRVVVREGFSRDLLDALMGDAKDSLAELRAHPPSQPAPTVSEHGKVC
ncbi:MAG: glutamate decarboxylase [Acidimicrobiia bacterium]|nr:glutamate decarboxylase [Acidimicrobiia bacterium]